MINENFILKYFDNAFSLQVLKLKDSFYIYLGTQQMEMNNLSLSLIYNNETKDNSTINIFEDDEISGSYSTMLAKSISLKFKVPIFLSMNISNEKLLASENFISFLDEEICKIIEKIKN